MHRAQTLRTTADRTQHQSGVQSKCREILDNRLDHVRTEGDRSRSVHSTFRESDLPP